MSKISDLTAQLEQQSKELQESTRKELSSVFNEHKKALRKELKNSESTISADIHGSTQILRSQAFLMRRTALHSWMYLLLTIIIALASIQGVLWYQGNQIAENLATIEQQNQTLKALQDQTFGLRLLMQDGSQLIVFPKNKKPSQPWQSTNGQMVIEMENK